MYICCKLSVEIAILQYYKCYIYEDFMDCKMKYIVFLLLLILSNNCFCLAPKCDTNEVNNANDKILEMVYNEPTKALKLAKKNAEQAKICKHAVGEIRAVIRQGIAYEMLSKNKEAIIAYESAIQLSIQNKYVKGEASCYNNIGLIYWNNGDFKNALTYYFKALRVFEQINNYTELGAVQDNIGLIYSELYDNKKAKIWYYKSLESYQKANFPDQVNVLYSNMGNLYYRLENLDSAHHYDTKAIAGFEKSGNLYGILIVNEHKTENLLINKKFKEAEILAFQSMKIAKEIENDISYLHAAINLIHARLELDKGQLPENELLYLLALAEKIDNPKFLTTIYEQVSISKGIQGKTKESWQYAKKANYETKRYIQQKQDENSAKMQAVYDIEKEKEKTKIALLEKDKIVATNKIKSTFQNYLVIGLIFLIIVSIISFYLIVSRKNLKQKITKEREVFEAQLNERKRISFDLHDALGSQLSFLVNNLEILQTEITDNKRIERSYTMAQESISSLRDSIWTLHHAEISYSDMEQKLRAMAVKLLDLNKIETHFDFDYEKNDVMKSDLAFNILKILQEVLSNLIKHSNAQNFYLTLKQNHSNCFLEMRDDGVGVSLVCKKEGHYGMQSLAHRVELINGNLQISSEPNKGFKINIDWHC